jgi:hypothetical protein
MSGRRKNKGQPKKPNVSNNKRRKRRNKKAPARGARGLLGPRTAMPQAFSNSVRASRPLQVTKRERFDVRYEFERLNQTTKDGYLVQDIQVSPANSSRFSRAAENYQKYRIVSAKVAIVSGFNVCSGSYVAAYISDPSEIYPREESISDILFENPTAVCDSWYISNDLDMSSIREKDWLFTDAGTGDIRLHSPGRLILACDATPSQPGTMRFVASYEVEFADKTSSPKYSNAPMELILGETMTCKAGETNIEVGELLFVDQTWFMTPMEDPTILIGKTYALAAAVSWSGSEGTTANDFNCAYAVSFHLSAEHSKVMCQMIGTANAGHNLTMAHKGARIYNADEEPHYGSWSRSVGVLPSKAVPQGPVSHPLGKRMTLESPYEQLSRSSSEHVCSKPMVPLQEPSASRHSVLEELDTDFSAFKLSA